MAEDLSSSEERYPGLYNQRISIQVSEQNHLYQQSPLQNGHSLISHFCRKSEESLEHLFIYCEFSRDFWLSVTLWLKDFFKDLDDLNATNIIFGFFTEGYLLLNHILIICKQVIFQCRNRNIKPSLSLLKVKLKYVYISWNAP